MTGHLEECRSNSHAKTFGTTKIIIFFSHSVGKINSLTVNPLQNNLQFLLLNLPS